jgi:hypothetical protein
VVELGVAGAVLGGAGKLDAWAGGSVAACAEHPVTAAATASSSPAA